MVIVRRRGVLGTAMGVAATASMVSTARTNRAVRKNIEGQNQAQQPSQPAPTDDTAIELKKLKGLLDQGLISETDYEAKKKQILGL